MYLRLKTAKSHITSILVGDFCSDDLKNWEELRIRVSFSFSFSFFFLFHAKSASTNIIANSQVTYHIDVLSVVILVFLLWNQKLQKFKKKNVKIIRTFFVFLVIFLQKLMPNLLISV